MIRGLVSGLVGGMVGGLLPSADPTLVLDLNFISSSLPDGLTFSRASAATDIINGVLTSFASGAARISTANGYLSEPARTNLAKNNSSAATAGTLVQGATDPAGASLAYTYTETATNTCQQWSVGSATISYVSGTTYTASAYMKAGTCDRVQMFVSSSVVTSGNGYANYYLNGAGSVSVTGAGFTSASIERLGATGWYRIVATFTCNNTASQTLSFCTLTTGSETRKAPTILGTSRTMTWFGPQVEVGAFVTSYIPTTTASVTRAADTLTRSVTGIFGTTGTVVCEATSPRVFASSEWNVLFDFNNGSSDANKLFSGAYNGTANVQSIVSSSAVFTGVCGDWPVGTTQKLGSAFTSNDFINCRNGSLSAADTSGSVAAGLVNLNIGYERWGGRYWNGYVRRLSVYNVRKSNTDLQAMTT